VTVRLPARHRRWRSTRGAAVASDALCGRLRSRRERMRSVPPAVAAPWLRVEPAVAAWPLLASSLVLSQEPNKCRG
jgi:hypothetical protein